MTPPQCELDLTEVKQLQGQDMHFSKIVAKCKSQHHHNKTPYHQVSMGLYTEMSGMNQISSTPQWFPQNYNPTFYMKAIMLMAIIDPQGYIIALKDFTIRRNCMKTVASM